MLAALQNLGSAGPAKHQEGTFHLRRQADASSAEGVQ